MRLHTTNSENNKPIPRSKNNQGRARTLENDPPFICGVIIFALIRSLLQAQSKLLVYLNRITMCNMRRESKCVQESVNRGFSNIDVFG